VNRRASHLTRADLVVAATGGTLALLAGVAARTSPTLPLALMAAVLAIGALFAVNPRYLLCGIIYYIPFEAVVASHVHGRGSLVALYVAEIMAMLVLFRLLVSEHPPPGRRLGLVGIALAGVTAAWVVAGAWGGRSPYTMLVGYRAELRFLPLLFIPLFTRHPLRDAKLFGRTVVFAATIQAVIAFLEIAGGTFVRHLVEHSFTTSIAGVTLKYSSRTNVVASTFRNYNDLSSFLILGWVVLVCGGVRGLGLPKWFVIPVAVLIPIDVIASGSREGTLALILAMLVVASRRYRIPAITGAVVLGLVGLLYLPYAINSSAPNQPSSAVGAKSSGSVSVSQVMNRWSLLLNSSTYSGQAHSHNFRLYLALSEAGLVAGHHPLVGYGLGSITDKRFATAGTSPLDLIEAGREAIAQNFAFDGNWSLLVVEVGFVGVLATWFLLLALGRAGWRLASTHWIGLVLAVEALVVFVLGFFASVLQQHVTSAVLWATAGYAIAVYRSRPSTQPIHHAGLAVAQASRVE
jgi:hypothetical protein